MDDLTRQRIITAIAMIVIIGAAAIILLTNME